MVDVVCAKRDQLYPVTAMEAGLNLFLDAHKPTELLPTPFVVHFINFFN